MLWASPAQPFSEMTENVSLAGSLCKLKVIKKNERIHETSYMWLQTTCTYKLSVYTFWKTVLLKGAPARKLYYSNSHYVMKP